MDSRSAYRLQLMEKLGAPLLSALPAGMDGEKAAETVAALIGRSVQAGLQLSQSMRLSDTDGDIDSIRLSLAAIAAPLLADAYKSSGRIPEDSAIEKLVKGLEAALVFAENFTPAIEHTARLKSLHDPLPVVDAAQIPLLTLNALSPAVQAVQHFPFGQNEAGLIKDIAARLEKNAAQLSTATVIGNDGDQAFAKLIVLKALADLFAAAHRQVLAGHQGSAAPDIAAVWSLFDQQVAMMMALTGAAVPMAGGDAKAPAPVAQQGGSPMGFFKKPDEAAVPETPPPASAPPPAQTGGSPMAFFKPGTKKAEGGE